MNQRHANSTAWQRERARRLHRFCLAIERKRERGQPVRKSIKGPCHYWKGRSYHCDPARKFRISPKTLLRVYYIWRANGKTPQAVALPSRSRPSALVKARVMELARLCLAPGNRSVLSAYRNLQNPGRTYRSFWDLVPPPLLTLIRKLHRARSPLAALERKGERLLKQMEEAAQ